MDEIFDIRPYLQSLFNRWPILLGGTILAGILAVIISFFLPPTYRAESLVLIVDPNQLLQFDPRFETIDETRPRQAYPTLATTDSLLQMLLRTIAPEVDEPDTLKELREIISISTSSDPSLLELQVEHRDPVTAANIANKWAELFISQANQVVGDQSQIQLDFYRSQRDDAQAELNRARRRLVEFQSRNRTRLIRAELTNLEAVLNESLTEQNGIVQLQQDIDLFQAQLEGQSGPLVTADQYALLLIYGRIFSDNQQTLPLQLQFDSSIAETTDRSQALDILESLQTTLTEQWQNLDDQINELEPELLALQEELQIVSAEEEQLIQELALASETYTALARQMTEEQITSQDTSRGLRLASTAVIPEEPFAPQKILNGLLAAVVAFAGLVAVILFRHWYTHNAGS